MGEKTGTPHKCPVCGKTEFRDQDSYDVCPVCDWIDNLYQRENPEEWGLANRLSLNTAKRQYETYGTSLPCDLWEKCSGYQAGWENKLKNIDQAPGKYTEFLRLKK